MTYDRSPREDIVAAGSRFGSITAKSRDSSSHSNARSTAPLLDECGVAKPRCCCDPQSPLMVKAFTPDSPSLVSIVWRRECSTKSPGKIGCRWNGFEMTSDLLTSQSDNRDEPPEPIKDIGSIRHRVTVNSAVSFPKLVMNVTVIFPGATRLS